MALEKWNQTLLVQRTKLRRTLESCLSFFSRRERYLIHVCCCYYELACIRSDTSFSADDMRQLRLQLMGMIYNGPGRESRKVPHAGFPQLWFQKPPSTHWMPDPKDIFGGVRVTVDELVAEAQARRSAVQ